MEDEALQITTTSGIMQGIRLLAAGDENDPAAASDKSGWQWASPKKSGKAPKSSKKINKIYKAHLKQRRKILKAARKLDPGVGIYNDYAYQEGFQFRTALSQTVLTQTAHKGDANNECSETQDADTYIRTWRGVPYGEDTAGEHRFRAPRPYQFRPGVRDCSVYGQPALQPNYGMTEATIGSEDCLNLDIVRPDSEEVLPVVVYLHGGSFFMGASHSQLLRGHTFAVEMNAVYVTINFRLGALGYLDMRSIGNDCVANPALLDQLLALRWVQHNIANFGGDPNNVTLMGESAGAAAAITLMCVPAAQGLFHRVIAQSTPGAAVHSPAQSAFWAKRLRKRLKLGEDASLQDFRELSGQEVMRAGQSMMWRAGQMWALNPTFATTVDHLVLHEHPLVAFRRGHQLKVPLIVGTNGDEVSMVKSLYVRAEARGQAARRILESYDATHTAAILEQYAGATKRQDYANLLGDAVFWAPSVLVAQAHARVADTWMYRFDFASIVMKLLGLGAMHTTELTPIFGDYNAAKMSMTQLGVRKDLNALGEIMQGYWRRFIWAGNPGTGWPQYALAADKRPGRATLVFDKQPHVVYDPKANYRRVWESFDLTQWEERSMGFMENIRKYFLVNEPDAPADSATIEGEQLAQEDADD